ncbi:MAG: heat-inducible transcriptional repressor HrcA [Rhodospirillaceae bacterium]|nr:heat-inducible transcriptional repressor HrcA [Rhodospirillaceae bacterium]
MIDELNGRSRQIFREIVESFVETGEPVGSRTLARRLPVTLSPATVRNVMADLEDMGLLFSPHTSAGRLPTETGLRLYVDGLLEVGNLTEDERANIKSQCAGTSSSVEGLLEQATQTLSGLAHCASLVIAPKTESPLKHIEFVHLSPGRALVILVTESGVVENRIMEIPADLPASALVQATNYLSAKLVGNNIADAYDGIMAELENQRAELDVLTAKLVEGGLATWAGGDTGSGGSLIVRGQAHLLEDVNLVTDLERIRGLFSALETKEQMLRILSMADRADGVQIFIGADNTLFNVSGCSMVVKSYRNEQQQIIGAVGVIGPTRMNYSRIIPMVDYTADLIGGYIGLGAGR